MLPPSDGRAPLRPSDSLRGHLPPIGALTIQPTAGSVAATWPTFRPSAASPCSRPSTTGSIAAPRPGPGAHDPKACSADQTGRSIPAARWPRRSLPMQGSSRRSPAGSIVARKPTASMTCHWWCSRRWSAGSIAASTAACQQRACGVLPRLTGGLHCGSKPHAVACRNGICAPGSLRRAPLRLRP